MNQQPELFQSPLLTHGHKPAPSGLSEINQKQTDLRGVRRLLLECASEETGSRAAELRRIADSMSDIDHDLTRFDQVIRKFGDKNQ